MSSSTLISDNFYALRQGEVRRMHLPRGLRLLWGSGTCVLAILLNPVALLLLLVFVLHGAPGHTVGAVLFSVLILRGVEGLLVDLLGVLGQIVLDVIR